MIVVSEIFGPTVQGEGPALGTRCGFVRLGRCGLTCSWCDSKFTWQWDEYDPAVELTEMTVDAIVAAVAAMDVDTVVITGGEPLLQQSKLPELFSALPQRVHVETAGVFAWKGDPALVDQWVVSPKLANSGMDYDTRIKADVLRDFATQGAAFKFVVTSPDDLDEIHALVEACSITNVWVMPEGTDAVTLTRRTAELADAVIARGWNLTTRLHVLAWGDKRGV